MDGGVLNFAVATTVFLYTSHCVAEATGELTAWIVGAPGSKRADVKPRVLPIFQRMEETRAQRQRETGLPAPAPNKPTTTAAPSASNRTVMVRCAVGLVLLWVLNMVSF